MKKELLIAGVAIAGTYATARAVANKRTEPEDIDIDNLYIAHGGESGEAGKREKLVVEVGIPTTYEAHIKPLLDKVLSFCGLVVLSPVLGCIALAIILEDSGPVFFTQKRVGGNGTYFMLHKFRTMRMSTPHDVPTHMLKNPESYITRVGAVLRKTSLDELPQIWDIFRGKMSVIGPRPALWNQDNLVAERSKYGANDVLPGLTGLAQISGRDELEIPVKAAIDGEYVSTLRWSSWAGFAMDLRCFFGTVDSVLKHDGVVEGGTGALPDSSDDFQTEITTGSPTPAPVSFPGSYYHSSVVENGSGEESEEEKADPKRSKGQKSEPEKFSLRDGVPEIDPPTDWGVPKTLRYRYHGTEACPYHRSWLLYRNQF